MNALERHHETNYHKQRSQNFKVIAKKRDFDRSQESCVCTETAQSPWYEVPPWKPLYELFRDITYNVPFQFSGNVSPKFGAIIGETPSFCSCRGFK